jgi:cytochrome c oxidase subunit 1
MYSTLLVAIPTGVKFFSWVGTLWKGKLSFPTPMLFVLGAMVVFLLGGVTGPPNGIVTTDLHLHDTYWVVGHFHNTMFGGYIFPLFAAIYFWFPKITGRMYNEVLGKIHFWLLFIGFETMSIGQMQVGLLGMRRRIADYDPGLGIENIQFVITIAGFVVFFAVLVGLYNIIRSVKHGEVTEGNIWRSRSPEWQRPNPAPLVNYPEPFKVTGEPYDYGKADSTYVDMSPAQAAAD